MGSEIAAPRGRATVRRVIAVSAGVLVVFAGLAVHLLAPDGFASDAAGDALYAALIYLLGVALAPRAAAWLLAASA